MLRELKKIWGMYKILIIILILLEIITLSLLKINKDLYYLIILISTIYLFFNIEKREILMFQISFPVNNFSLIIDKFFATIIPFIIFTFLPFALNPEIISIQTISFLFLLGILIFLFNIFEKIYYPIFYLLFYLLTQIIFPNLHTTIDGSHIHTVDYSLVIFIILFFIFFIYDFSLYFTDKIYHKIRLIIIFSPVFLILFIPLRIIQKEGLGVKVNDIYLNGAYISIIKDNEKNICYLLNKKKRLHIFDYSKAYIWDNKNIYFYENRVYRGNMKLYRDKINISNYDKPKILYKKYLLYALKNFFPIPENIYFVYFNLYKFNYSTNNNYLMLKKVKVIYQNYMEFIKYKGKIYFINFFNNDELVKIDPQFGLLFDDDSNIYYFNEKLIMNIKKSVLLRREGKIKYVNPRVVTINNQWYTPYKNRIYKIPKNSKFLLNKIYFIKNERIILKGINSNIIFNLPLPQKIKGEFLLHYYNGDYFLFIYKEKPLKIYILKDKKWELYDKIW